VSAAAAAAEAGLILAPWNPDESWEADDLVRIYAIHGAMEARHVVYEHIEVLVHPIRVHLTAALAGALQDYFNLREEEAGKDKEAKPAGRAQEAAAARAAKQAGGCFSHGRNQLRIGSSSFGNKLQLGWDFLSGCGQGFYGEQGAGGGSSQVSRWV
jgi:hypothetical protein